MRSYVFIVGTLLLLFLLSSPVVFGGEDTLLFSGALYSGDITNIDGTLYEAKLNTARDKMLLNDGTNTVFVNRGQCTATDPTYICFNSVIQETIDHYMNVSIYERRPILDISYNVTPKSVFLGESFEVDVFFNNTGGRSAQGELYIPLPNGAAVERAGHPCYQSGNEIRWSGVIGEDETISCYVRYVAHEPFEVLQQATLSYTHRNASYDVRSPSVSLEANHSILMNMTVFEIEEENNSIFIDTTGNVILPINETFNLEVFLLNFDDEQAYDVDMYLIIPETFKIRSDSWRLTEMSRSEGNVYYHWPRVLDVSGILWESFKLKGLEVSQNRIYAYANYTVNGKRYVLDQESIYVNITPFEVNKSYCFNNNATRDRYPYYFDQEGPLVDETNASLTDPRYREPYNVTYWVHNCNSRFPIEDATIYLYSDDEVIGTSHIDELKPGIGYLLGPYTYDAGITPITYRGDIIYRRNGTLYNASDSITVTPRTLGELSISTAASNEEPLVDEVIKYTVTLSTTGDNSFHTVQVRDTVEGGQVISGSTNAVVFVPENRSTQAYSYYVKAIEGTLNMSTQASYTIEGTAYTVNETTSLAVGEGGNVDIVTVFPSSIRKGEVVPVEYTITNNGERRAQDIVLSFLPSRVIGYERSSFTIELLLPGNGMTFTNYIHMNQQGNYSLPNATLSYDYANRTMLETINGTTISLDTSFGTSPLISVVLDVIKNGDIFTNNIMVTNLGDQAATVSVWGNTTRLEAGDTWSMSKENDRDLMNETDVQYAYLGRTFNLGKAYGFTDMTPRSIPGGSASGDDARHDRGTPSVNSPQTPEEAGGSLLWYIVSGIMLVVVLGGSVGFLLWKRKHHGGGPAVKIEYLTESDKKSSIPIIPDRHRIKEA